MKIIDSRLKYRITMHTLSTLFWMSLFGVCSCSYSCSNTRQSVCVCFVIITSLQVLCLYFEPTKKPSYTKAKNVFSMCIFIASMLFDILNRAYGNAKCANNSATSFSVHYKTECIYSMLVLVPFHAFWLVHSHFISPLLDY